ncbi:MAG: hypothetical protein PHH54_01685 [Candidatus Nanoarchaeia archaeon]|nr:hypothetical protein [Candidatus Nanoarchaeia archaeon]MDD5740673.1 hypothetical protein [Candidatus Nanoarchaeia archaeon]
MPILCPYNQECYVLAKNPSYSRSYKLRVEHTCNTPDYTNCFFYQGLEKSKANNEHTPENLGKLKKHMRKIISKG